MDVEEARAWLDERLEEGVRCPVCDQHAQTYRWSLYDTALRALSLYARLAEGRPDGWVHTRELKAAGHTGQGDAARLRLWGLLERDLRPREDGGKSGQWRVTPSGFAFLHGGSVPKYMYVYNNEAQGSAGPMVTYEEMVGTRFSYDEVVG